VITAGLPPERVTVVLDEIEAVNTAIDLAEPGDLVVALVYRIPRVWTALMQRMGQATEPAAAPTPESVHPSSGQHAAAHQQPTAAA
jgi:hypothetical protein